MVGAWRFTRPPDGYAIAARPDGSSFLLSRCVGPVLQRFLVPCHLGWRGLQNLRAGFESRKGPPTKGASRDQSRPGPCCSLVPSVPARARGGAPPMTSVVVHDDDHLD